MLRKRFTIDEIYGLNLLLILRIQEITLAATYIHWPVGSDSEMSYKEE